MEIFSTESIDKQLDFIYDLFDDLMRLNNLKEIDEILLGIDVKKFSIDILLGILTATFPVHSKLLNRHKFFEDVKAVLIERNEYEDGLLKGLE